MTVPDALQRREILYGTPKRKPDFAQLGQDYRNAGRLSDACESFERVADEGERAKWLGVLRDDAIKAGNWFLLNRVANSIEISEDSWRQTLDKAREQGKLRYALKIAERLGDEAQTTELKRELGLAIPEPEGEGEDGEGEGEGESEDAAAEGDDAK